MTAKELVTRMNEADELILELMDVLNQEKSNSVTISTNQASALLFSLRWLKSKIEDAEAVIR